MRSFLAVAVAPTAPDELRRPVAAATACLADNAEVSTHADGWIAYSGPDPGDVVPASGAVTMRLGRMLRTRGGDVSTSALPKLLDDSSRLVDLLPPFAAAHRPVDGPVTVAVDWLGFHQLYWWQGDGVAAVSSSARALAVLAGGGFDPVGLGVQALIGWQVSDTTVFRGVRTVPPATIATLDAGTISLRRYAEPPTRPSSPPTVDSAADEMAALLREWQTGYLVDHPDAMLQLTGGHDSRILLAAIPRDRRAGVGALTLGDPSSPDVVIAARLAARDGLRHQVYRLDQQQPPTPEEAHTLALVAARALECQASPLALAPLMLAEANLPQGHRLAGLGGEVARGFYYAGQPGGASTSPALVERLARWRLFSNEAVEAGVLAPSFVAEARTSTLATLSGLFPAGDWLHATDDFYLFHRMHRWAGGHGTVAAVRRFYVNPMFDRRFVELALAVDPADKRDSLLLGRIMTRLDPELARIPLDSGLRPSQLASRSFSTRLAVTAQTGRKAVRKVGQRLTRGRRAQLGAAEFGNLVLAHWRAEPKAAQPLYDVDLIRPDWLDGLLQGTHDAQPTTLAFLLNVLAATDR
ncbi:hypothetical protein [Virgisporangium aurantiacum]|uniref:Asparagine synthase (Glutamine-hydrolysing) n=1 Tax=Virgisporangium aurantiacum TaxID=175570 RepID=A0A8J3ZEK7_9ACTN|nr:hypothetical protein [Virgisporangium aurantiacum]GIJ59858.1 hypothetical protein Vau01_073740 [Virgisporangium aurantiacum]